MPLVAPVTKYAATGLDRRRRARRVRRRAARRRARRTAARRSSTCPLDGWGPTDGRGPAAADAVDARGAPRPIPTRSRASPRCSPARAARCSCSAATCTGPAPRPRPRALVEPAWIPAFVERHGPGRAPGRPPAGVRARPGGRVPRGRPRGRRRHPARLPPRLRPVRRRRGRPPRRLREGDRHATELAGSVAGDLRAVLARWPSRWPRRRGGHVHRARAWVAQLRDDEQATRASERRRPDVGRVSDRPGPHLRRAARPARPRRDRDRRRRRLRVVRGPVRRHVHARLLHRPRSVRLPRDRGSATRSPRRSRTRPPGGALLGDGAIGFSLGDLDSLARHHATSSPSSATTASGGSRSTRWHRCSATTWSATSRPETRYDQVPRTSAATASWCARRARPGARPRVRVRRPRARERAHRPRRRLPEDEQPRLTPGHPGSRRRRRVSGWSRPAGASVPWLVTPPGALHHPGRVPRGPSAGQAPRAPSPWSRAAGTWCQGWSRPAARSMKRSRSTTTRVIRPAAHQAPVVGHRDPEREPPALDRLEGGLGLDRVADRHRREVVELDPVADRRACPPAAGRRPPARSPPRRGRRGAGSRAPRRRRCGARARCRPR